MTRARIDTEAMDVPARNPRPVAHDQEMTMTDFETHPVGTKDRIAVMEAQCELWWGMLNDKAALIREYKARAERAEAALLEDADAKLARNEIELLGCHAVHPDHYENDPEAPEARRAFLANLIAPFLARIRELEAQLADGSFYKEDDIDALQARAERAEAALAALKGGEG